MDSLDIKNKLRIRLNREPKEHEVVNGANDIGIVHEILEDRVADLEARVATLEKHKK